MKILKCGTVTRNSGCDIVQEDWSADYKFHKPGDQLAAYPEATASGGRFKRGKKFRLGMSFRTTEAAEAAFTALTDGTAKLQDYVEFFNTVPGEKKHDILAYLG